MTGVAGMQALLDRLDEAIQTVDRQANFLPDNTAQINHAIATLGAMAQLVVESDDMDNSKKQELGQSCFDVADSLLMRARELGADTSDWLDKDPASHLLEFDR